MNKKLPLLLLAALSLSSCAKTRLLYGENAYNSPVFDENYYTEWEGIDKLEPTFVENGIPDKLNCSLGNPVKVGDHVYEEYTWTGEDETQFGYAHNLSDIEKKFSYGITSKLFDGRVWCDGLYQKSRVQLDKTGFAMYFKKSLVSAKFLGFSVRGGTNFYEDNLKDFSYSDLKVNFVWSFYIHLDDGRYKRVDYKINGAQIPVDYNSATAFVNFVPLDGENFWELYDAVGMSLTWECVDERYYANGDLSDDYKVKEKHHLALMLYEVFIGDSVWF